MSDFCDHSKYSESFKDCNEPGHPEDCVVSTCDNCNAPLGHDYGMYDNIQGSDSLGQQFRDIIYHGGALDAFKNPESGETSSTSESEGYKCTNCGKQSNDFNEMLNHKCNE